MQERVLNRDGPLKSGSLHSVDNMVHGEARSTMASVAMHEEWASPSLLGERDAGNLVPVRYCVSMKNSVL